MKNAKLIGYRNMALLTQTDMAKYLEIAYPTYNAKENGRNGFTDNEKSKIKLILSEKLGKSLTIDELFF